MSAPVSIRLTLRRLDNGMWVMDCFYDADYMPSHSVGGTREQVVPNGLSWVGQALMRERFENISSWSFTPADECGQVLPSVLAWEQ